MKNNDIYSWRYNVEKLKKLNDGNNGGTTYWCNSCIGIWNDEYKKLIDTYWGTGSDNKVFTEDQIRENLELKYIGNLDELRSCNRSEFNNYDKEDCVNISHANMMRGGFYIKKDAKPSLEKKRKVLQAHIDFYKHEMEYSKMRMENLQNDLNNLTIDTIVPCHPDVYV